MKSNGVWLELQLPTPGFVTTLAAGRAGKLVIAAPPHGEAWRLPVMWGYRLTGLQLLKNRGDHLLAICLLGFCIPRPRPVQFVRRHTPTTRLRLTHHQAAQQSAGAPDSEHEE